MEQHRARIVSQDRALVQTWSFPVVSGIIQLVFGPRGTGWLWELLPCWLWGPWLSHSLLLGQVLDPGPLRSFFVCRPAPQWVWSPEAAQACWHTVSSSFAPLRGSLAPLVLCAGLWAPPVLAVLLLTRGHLLLPELVFPPSAVSAKRFHGFVALTNNEA